MEFITEAKEEFKTNEEKMKQDFSAIHSGRATPALIDGVLVSSYGQMMSIKNVSSISVEDARTLRIVPWDKNQIKDIEKSLLLSNLGFSIVSDDGGVRAIVPQMTGENREKMVKIIKQKLEDFRIRARQIREKFLKLIEQAEKEKKISEDQKKNLKEKLQTETDTTNENLRKIFELKESEIINQ